MLKLLLRRIFYAKKQVSGCYFHNYYGNNYGLWHGRIQCCLNTGTVNGTTFLAATHELPIMVPIAFVLEFFVVGKIAKMLAFTVMRPTDRPQFITYAISICICCIMCPIMSLVATFLFKEPSFGMWVKTWAMNFPMAICYQMFYCGPLVRLIFRAIFVRKNAEVPENMCAVDTE